MIPCRQISVNDSLDKLTVSGLLAYRDLDHALELFDSVSTVFNDKRTGRNIQHAMPTLLRQTIYSRLAD